MYIIIKFKLSNALRTKIKTLRLKSFDKVFYLVFKSAPPSPIHIHKYSKVYTEKKMYALGARILSGQ